jgi:glucosamine kinase
MRCHRQVLNMPIDTFLLGIDGGGTRCRARLCTAAGARLADAVTGPANIRLGFKTAMIAVMSATDECLDQAGLSKRELNRITACLALAGASEPTQLALARRHKYPFAQTILITDAQAACVGAHRGTDGGVIIVGTGTIGWGELKGRQHRVGGWGLLISDEGSGAWIGCEALRRVLWAHDGRVPWTGLLDDLFNHFRRDPHAIVRWTTRASPRDYGSFAPLVVSHASKQDPAATELMRRAAGHIDALAARLLSTGVRPLALAGGLAAEMEQWVSSETRLHLIQPAGDALDGAIQLARVAAENREADLQTTDVHDGRD